MDERARLEKKPVLQWTQEDWQLWAAGLNDSRHVRVEDQPVPTEPVEKAPDPVEDRSTPVQAEQAPEPAPAKVAADVDTARDASVDTVGNPGVDTVRDPSQDAVRHPDVETEEPATQSSSLTSETVADELPAVQEPPPIQRPERAPASPPSSSGPSTTLPWPLRPPAAPVRTARVRARSAVGLVMLAVAVGALVAGLVTFVIVVSSLVVRRALGS